MELNKKVSHLNIYECSGHRNIRAENTKDAAEIFARRRTKQTRFGRDYLLTPTGYPGGGIIYHLQVLDSNGAVIDEDYSFGVSRKV